MITINNTFSGASFSYENEARTCTANGEYRSENGNLVSVNINGQYTESDVTYNFWAGRGPDGNVNISGVPASIIASVATEVASIISEIENPSAQDANEE